MKSSHTMFTCMTALICASPTLAQSDNNKYVTVNIGAAFPPDQDLGGTFQDDIAGPTGYFSETEFDPSFFGSVAWGYRFSRSNRSGFGFEAEGFFHALNPEGLRFSGLDLDPIVDDAEEFLPAMRPLSVGW